MQLNRLKTEVKKEPTTAIRCRKGRHKKDIKELTKPQAVPAKAETNIYLKEESEPFYYPYGDRLTGACSDDSLSHLPATLDEFHEEKDDSGYFSASDCSSTNSQGN